MCRAESEKGLGTKWQSVDRWKLLFILLGQDLAVVRFGVNAGAPDEA